MRQQSRREFLRAGTAGIALSALGWPAAEGLAAGRGRPAAPSEGRSGPSSADADPRVAPDRRLDLPGEPGPFCHAPVRRSSSGIAREYQKPWQTTPREIPDRFVRKFGLWCRQRGIKGKYSIIPYVRQPAELIVCLDLPKGKSQLRV